ncbi:hypothetical protein VNO77_19194 [Canavalia gladiata]|uniref:Uncharacterized protein n=1 Tax=Canavalia gladiata TaxID=3824 RepID=A0AAN9LM78_CANGL
MVTTVTGVVEVLAELPEMVDKVVRVLAWGIIRVRELILSLHVKEGALHAACKSQRHQSPLSHISVKPKVSWLLRYEAMQILTHVGDKRKAIHES